ncbi:aspartyl protease 25 [Phragmites australis]|uniref:aspartyl protease 25 n=1 Tax=Phragmites australis TaxID=29695 RepID=UPI002D779C80|nr:aspartyl protease 25 [Phragmites australis]
MAATTILLLLSATVASAADLSVYHNVHPSSPSPLESIIALARDDDARLLFLSSKAASSGLTSAPVASGQTPPSYVVRAGLGTPVQQLLLALDTSADATWAHCAPCDTCPAGSRFIPASSSSYASLPCASSWCPLFQGEPCPANQDASAPPPTCAFAKPFADASFQASLASDTLRLGKDAIANYTFGCVGSVTGPTSNLPKQGLLGLGRGPMALLSQTGGKYNGVFSYCLPSYKSYYFSGSLRLGAAGQPRSARYTPLLSNPHRPSLYYVNVTGLSVGRAWVTVPAGSFAFDPNTGAGTVIDSGTVITRWTAPVYAALREEFRRQVAAPSGYTSLGAFDTCFNTDEVAAGGAPTVTVHMDGGVDLTLPMENTLIHSSATPLACLAMAEAPQNVNAVVNVVANLQQQNVRVVFDVANSRVGFAREACN